MKKFYLLLILFSLNIIVFANNKSNENKDTPVSHEVYFKTNKYNVTPEEHKKLITFLNSVKDVSIERMAIYGFCDDRGSYEYNKILSNNRAKTVKDIIIKHRNDGTEPRVFNIDGKGELELNVSKETLVSDIRKRNRKVVISILPKNSIQSAFNSNLKAGDLINLKSLKFKKNVRHLESESIQPLKELANFLVKRTDIYFTVYGHVCCTYGNSDAIDKDTGKKNLSVVRAQYIRNYLVKKGVDPKRIKYIGLAGKQKLGGKTKDDRRVEIYIRYILKNNKAIVKAQ